MMKFSGLLLLSLLVSSAAFAPLSAPTASATTGLSSSLTKDDFTNSDVSLLAKLNKAKVEKNEPLIERILEPSYTVTIATAAAGPLISYLYDFSLIGTAGNCVHVVLTALLFVQTLRVRCAFEEDGFEFYNLKGDMDMTAKKSKLTRKPGNFVTKTPNKWSYDKVTGYQFYPSIQFPLICYLKETQTPEGYNIVGEQPHVFPALFMAEQFKDEMDKRGVTYGV